MKGHQYSSGSLMLWIFFIIITENHYTIHRSPPSPCCTLADSTVSYEPWQAGADVGRAAGVAALSALGNVTRMGAFFAGVCGSARL